MRGACLIALVAAFHAVAQPQSDALHEPSGPANPLLSPDRTRALYGEPEASHLWLENRRTHQRQLVTSATVQTLTLAWSPDSAAFIVNDRWASDQEMAYVYIADTLKRIDLRAPILAADPDTNRFVPGPHAAPHSYFHALRWLDPQHVEVRFHGHTDGVRQGNAIVPGDCFDLHYRVSLDGAVTRLSQKVFPLTSEACKSID
jgi:hypothetical protein